MSILTNYIKNLDPGLTDAEAIIAEGNLIGFFKVLERVEMRTASENEVYISNKQSNEDNHENI